MTAAHARLMLYELLKKLGDWVLYCDMDSVIFLSRDGDWIPPLCPYLGDLMDEINDGDLCGTEHNDFVTEYVSAGPKCYTYLICKNKTAIKCKGVTLNAKKCSSCYKGHLSKTGKWLCE